MTDRPLPSFPRGAAVTVGMFDGIHLGHRAVIARLVERARNAGRPSVLVTFEPHPLAVLRPMEVPERLSTPTERLAALAETELDYLAVLRFDAALGAQAPEQFVTETLMGRFQMADLVIGHDHGFGRGRAGDAEVVKALGKARGFEVSVVEPVAGPGGSVVSSTAIRKALAAADFRTARALLGRPYRVSGPVERGAGRGRTIGIPTVNLAPPAGKLLPPDGVYAVRVEWGGGTAGGMMNQGGRPTVGDGRRWLEAHLFDFEGDLYGREIRLEWVAPIRATQRFPSLDALRAQLERDRADARQALEQAGNL